MEVPCQLTFAGPGKELKKIRYHLVRDLSKLAALPPYMKEINSVALDNISMTPCTKEIGLERKVEEHTMAPSIDVWVIHGKHSLKLVDKVAIEQDQELNDKHIQMAQYLAKRQFPVTGSLESTLLEGKKRKGSCSQHSSNNSLQQRHHALWITASMKFSEPSKVDIYDMMFRKLDAETRITIKQLFGLKKADFIIMVAMQCQKGTTDCGLFAIATMTLFVFGEDPGTVHYDQSKLWKHLVDCISQGELSLFPKTS